MRDKNIAFSLQEKQVLLFPRYVHNFTAKIPLYMFL